ncbi:lytic transglycosylase [Beggiatoa sp. PS]|nr:lytic transglycosylase [Beggiatoa sp. PS]
MKRFKNVRLALAAYNSGETRVARLGRIPRIRETQRYVKRIMKSWQRGG